MLLNKVVVRTFLYVPLKQQVVLSIVWCWFNTSCHIFNAGKVLEENKLATMVFYEIILPIFFREMRLILLNSFLVFFLTNEIIISLVHDFFTITGNAVIISIAHTSPCLKYKHLISCNTLFLLHLTLYYHNALPSTPHHPHPTIHTLTTHPPHPDDPPIININK